MDIDSHELTFNCPSCGQEFSETIGRLRENPKIPCTGCGSVIVIKADELDSGLKSIDESLDSLREKLRKNF